MLYLDIKVGLVEERTITLLAPKPCIFRFHAKMKKWSNKCLSPVTHADSFSTRAVENELVTNWQKLPLHFYQGILTFSDFFNLFLFSQNPMEWIPGLAVLYPSNPLSWWNGLLNDSPTHPGSWRYSFPYSDHRAGHNQSIIHFAGNGSLTETRALWYPLLRLSRLSLHAWCLCPMMLR